MIVKGHEVSEATLEAAFEAVPEVFTLSRLTGALELQNVPSANDISYRAADRFIQKLRKADRIRYEGRCWHKT